MAETTTFVLGLILMLVMLVAAVGSIERRERVSFGLGVALIILILTLSHFVSIPAILGVIIVLAGFVAIIGSTVPLLRPLVQ